MTKPTDIAAWLNSIDPAYIAKPIVVQIGSKMYPGASYMNLDSREVIYCVGRLPSAYVRNTRTFFWFAECDWYIACYGGVLQRHQQQPISPEFHEFHPFGRSFSLMRHDGFDDGEGERDRMVITVIEC